MSPHTTMARDDPRKQVRRVKVGRPLELRLPAWCQGLEHESPCQSCMIRLLRAGLSMGIRHALSVVPTRSTRWENRKGPRPVSCIVKQLLRFERPLLARPVVMHLRPRADTPDSAEEKER